MSFSAVTYGKWILVGEHAVIRGVPALVFPTRKFAMKFTHDNDHSPFAVDMNGPRGAELEVIFWSLLEQALKKAGKKRSDLGGRLKIESSLPLGAGLGASAALCVGVARFFVYLKWIKEKDLYEFSRRLENQFHGESSGVDIAIAIEGRGLRFMRGGERTKLSPLWNPHLYLSYCGQRGVTADCVQRVKEMNRSHPELGAKIDGQMAEAVTLAEKALTQDLPKIRRFHLLAHSLDLARDAFYQWGLCDNGLDEHMKWLSGQGAISVKPTGSGGGGYVLSLWSKKPPAHLLGQLISLFEE